MVSVCVSLRGVNGGVYSAGVDKTTNLTPAEFLAEVAAAQPGWSQQHGGPYGVARMTVDLQRQVARMSEEIAAVRAAALQELLAMQSLATVAADLGISKQAASKASRAPSWKDPTW